MSIVKDVDSLFYSCLDHKKGTVLLNKLNISSAFQKGTHEVEITMSSGEKFNLALNATDFGKFIFDLKQIEHKSIEVKNP